MITLDLSILNQKGTPMFNSDLFANRPAAGIVGRIFISTDTKVFYRDTGTTWEELSGSTIGGSLATGQVAFGSATNTISGSNNLFWDAANNYLGIGTNTPTTALDVHHSTNSGAIFNQTTATNNNTINFQTSGSGRWRIGNFYTAGADDFGIFDVVGTLQQLTIVKSTGQTFIGAKTTASGRLVVNSETADAHLQVVGANSPSIRIDNAGSGGTQRFVIGNATATNNFIQGSAAGNFCITTASASALLFGMWQTTNASEVMRISTANNLLVGTTTDAGFKLDVNGTARVSGQITSAITADAFNRVMVSNTTNGTSSFVVFSATSDASAGEFQFGKYSTSKNSFAGINAKDGFIYNSTGGDIAILNAAATGTIKLFAGGSTTAQATLTNTGNLLVGTTTANGNRLQVSGTTRLANLVDYQLRLTDGTFNWDLRAIANQSNTDLRFIDHTGTATLTLFQGGNISIGNNANTARLHVFGSTILNGIVNIKNKLSLDGGTTSNAQINIASQTAPTSPNNGDIWFDGTNLFMRIGGLTKTFTII